MTIGQRIEARRLELGIPSQSELARRVPMGQSTLSGLIRKPYRWSPYLPKIARALLTTVEYLAGETDEPDDGAPSPAPSAEIVQVLLPVTLPSTDALARMFEGLLEVVDRSAPLDELARELAELLPTGLSALKGPLIEGEAAARLTRAARRVRATADREPAQ